MTHQSGDSAPRSGALVLDRQRSVTSPPERVGKRCPRAGWEYVLVGDNTLALPLNCKRWDCVVCGPRKARETARLLVNDAKVEAPTIALTLTTAQPWEKLDPAEYREGTAAVFKRLRRHYGDVAYFSHIEFTTGQARRSGGHRRMHGHYLCKFRRDRPDVLDAERLVRETWESVTGAYIVEVAELFSPGAAIGYLSLHHRKPQQQPPAGWSGMRSRPSLGYFHRPVAELRREARRQLAAEAFAWVKGTDDVEAAALELDVRRPTRWRVERVTWEVHDGSHPEGGEVDHVSRADPGG